MIIPDCRTALAWPQPPVRPVRGGVAQARARWKSAPSSSAASSEKTLSSCVSAQTSRDHRPNLPVPLHRRSASAPPLKPAVTGIRQDDDPPRGFGNRGAPRHQSRPARGTRRKRPGRDASTRLFAKPEQRGKRTAAGASCRGRRCPDCSYSTLHEIPGSDNCTMAPARACAHRSFTYPRIEGSRNGVALMNIRIHDEHSKPVPGPDRNHAAAPVVPGNHGRSGSGHQQKSGDDRRREGQETAHTKRLLPAGGRSVRHKPVFGYRAVTPQGQRKTQTD